MLKMEQRVLPVIPEIPLMQSRQVLRRLGTFRITENAKWPWQVEGLVLTQVPQELSVCCLLT